jgi:hypothetical protein
MSIWWCSSVLGSYHIGDRNTLLLPRSGCPYCSRGPLYPRALPRLVHRKRGYPNPNRSGGGARKRRGAVRLSANPSSESARSSSESTRRTASGSVETSIHFIGPPQKKETRAPGRRPAERRQRMCRVRRRPRRQPARHENRSVAEASRPGGVRRATRATHSTSWQ